MLNTANIFRHVLRDIESAGIRIRQNYRNLPEAEQLHLKDYYSSIIRSLSDVVSDIKGYTSLQLKYELQNIAVMDLNESCDEQ